MDIGERDIAGYGGMALVAVSYWALWGFWAAVGVLGALMLYAGMTTGGE